ncbi:MAG: hypothetical protein G8345_10170 [Magnetococcales bacterium]|nr:caspase family protein [Magnetococcales bacterium]NGZ27237.1 hypothetical protein [Magnetococcales bacterium]
MIPHRLTHLLWPLLVMLLLPLPGRAAMQVDSCPIAREMTVKGIDLFEAQKDKGLDALQRAYELCPTDLSVAYNYGLALYLADQKSEASDVWRATSRLFPDHLKTHANLAWVSFELGDDELSHILAFKSLSKYPQNMALIHTKLYSLFRLGRYLEAFDWLTRDRPPGVRGKKWYDQSISYVVETLWRVFRKGDRQNAVSRSVMMVKDYPEEPGLMAAKEQIVTAFVDPDAEVPFQQPLPHEIWPKKGPVDDEKEMLDDLVAVQPELEQWEKRSDAFALIIGITHYKRMQGRQYASRDAHMVRKLLAKRSIIPDDERHVRFRLDAQVTRASLADDLAWLVRQARLNPNAAILFYYSGHGITLTDAQNHPVPHLLPYDLAIDQISEKNTVSLGPIQKELSALPNKEIALVLETCFAGPTACGWGTQAHQSPPLESAHLGPKPMWAIAPVSEQAHHYFDNGRHGALTYFLGRALLGDADGQRDRADGWIDMDEAFRFIQQQYQAMKWPEPLLGKDSSFRISKGGGSR